MKVVLNKCFGGFGLSSIANVRYLEIKGIKPYFYKRAGLMDDKYEEITQEEFLEDEDFRKSIFKEKLLNGEYNNDTYFSYYSIDRQDEALIKVVEELGEKANGRCAELEIVEIPDGTEFEIDNYDGIETAHEVHNSW